MSVKILHLVFGLGAPIEVEVGGEKIKLIVHLKPLRLRTVLALIAKSRLRGKGGLDIPADYVFKQVLTDGIAQVFTSTGDAIDVDKLNPLLQQKLFHLILSVNGLTSEGQVILNKELEALKLYLLENLRNKGSSISDRIEDSELSELSFIANIAYSALSAGVPVSAPTLLDEPYLLILLAFTAAQAERMWLDEQGQSRALQSGAPDTIEIFPEDAPPPLHTLVPKRPVPKENVKETMLRIVEAISGYTFHREGDENAG